MQVLVAEYSSKAAAECMARVGRLSARYIGQQGFSIGIDDVTAGPGLEASKRKIVQRGLIAAEGHRSRHKQGSLKLQAGSNDPTSLEARTAAELSSIQQQLAEVSQPFLALCTWPCCRILGSMKAARAAAI